MDCIEVELLCHLCDVHLAGACAFLGKHSLLDIRLGVPDYFSEHLGEAGGVIGLFESIALESFCNLRIAFAVGLTAHCDVHSDLGAFAHEVVLETLKYESAFLSLRDFVGDSDYMLGNELQTCSLFHLLEFRSRNFALRAELRSGVTFVNIAANRADPFSHSNVF